MKQRLFLILLFLFPAMLIAQKKTGKELADSLKKEIGNAPSDTNKAKMLKNLSQVYSTFNPEEGIKYGKESLEMATDNNWLNGMAQANVTIGVNYEHLSHFSDALSHYLDALKQYERTGNKRGIALSEWGIGNIYRSQLNHEKSLIHNRRALQYFEGVNDRLTVSMLLLNIGNSFFLIDKYDSALYYFMRTQQISEEIGNADGIAKAAINVGSIYLKRHDYNKGLHYYFKCLQSIEETGNQIDFVNLLGNIGCGYLLIAKDSIGIKPDSLVAASRKDNLKLAILYLDSALTINKELGKIEESKSTAKSLSEALEEYGDYMGALKLYKEYVAFEDTLYSEQSGTKIAKMEAQRNIELKDRDLKIEHLKSTIFIISIVFLLITVLIIAVKFRKEVDSNKKLASEKEKHLEHIQVQGNTLKDIAYIQSHEVRGPVTTILGLSQLFNFEHPEDPQNKELMAGIASVAIKLDHTVTTVINKENNIKKGSV